MVTPSVAASTSSADTLKHWLISEGVTNDLASQLAKKHSQGKTLDSENGSTPVKVIKNDTAEKYVEKKIFADGSVSVSSIEKPTKNYEASSLPIARPAYVGSCETVSSGSGYRVYYDCRVQEKNGIVDLAFRATYQIVQGAYDKISSAWGGYYYSSGGSISGPKLTIPRANETFSYSAHAQYAVVFVASNGGSSRTYKLHLYIKNDTPSTSLTS
jgi:hypothetical protein